MPDNATLLVYACGALWISCAPLAGVVGATKGRTVAGVLLGFFFGPLGLLTVGLMERSARCEARHQSEMRRHHERMAAEARAALAGAEFGDEEHAAPIVAPGAAAIPEGSAAGTPPPKEQPASADAAAQEQPEDKLPARRRLLSAPTYALAGFFGVLAVVAIVYSMRNGVHGMSPQERARLEKEILATANEAAGTALYTEDLSEILTAFARLEEAAERAAALDPPHAELRYIQLKTERLRPRRDQARAKLARTRATEAKVAYELVGAVEDASIGSTRRVRVRIVVPPGRSRTDVRNTLARAARDTAEREKARAVMVLAYRPGDDPKAAHTVGRAVYAPNGRWEDARKSATVRVETELVESYFGGVVEKPQPHNVGDTVKLVSRTGTDVPLSSRWNDWSAAFITARVPNGATVTILEKRTLPVTANLKSIRYRVRVRREGVTVDGWVGESDITR